MRGIINRHNVSSDARDRSNLGRGRLAVAFTLLLLGVMSALSAPQAPVSGVWVVPDGVGYAPWTFNLKIDGTAVSGSVSMSLGDPMPIVTGRVDGSTVTFIVNSSEGARTVTFTGSLDGDQLRFTRDVVVHRQVGNGNGIVGETGVRQFVARRSSGPGANPQAAVRTPQSNAAPAVVVNAAPSGPVGRWQVINVPNAPWTFEFAVSGTSLTGTVQQNGVPPGPTSISAGKGDGPLITFKTLSPDGERVIAFTGQLNGNEISFTRQVTPLEGGSSGGNDVYGALAPVRFVARRVGSDRFNFSGVEVDIASVRSSPTRDATLEALRGQIAIIDAAVKDPAQKAFLKSVPLAMAASPGATPNNAAYSSGTKSVVLQSVSYDADKPVLLHELMHAYHDQKLPNGFANADIQKLFQQARSSGQFPAGSYMLSNVAEYFAMMSSVYLHGSAARDPFTRQTIKEKQPDCYEWLVKEFGPR